MEWIKTSAKLIVICLAIFFALFFVFREVVDFSRAQSTCLAAVALLCLIAATYRGARESDRDAVAREPEANWGRVAADFSPHSIHVLPKWPEILANYRLVAEKDEAEFRQLCEEMRFHRPISFNVLQGKWGIDEPGLIHWPPENSFSTVVDFWRFIPEFNLDAYFKKTDRSITPKLRLCEKFFFRGKPRNSLTHEEQSEFMRQIRHQLCKKGRSMDVAMSQGKIEGYSGYELSLTIDAHWWNWLCETGGVRIPPLDAETSTINGDTILILAILPLSEVLGYYDPYGIRRYGGDRTGIVKSRLKSLPTETSELERLNALSDSSGVWEKIRDRELTQNGWKRNDSEDDNGAIHPCVEHEFFTVTHWGI